MLLRLRVSLPDRPGVLGQVARAFGVMGADILQVTVLERQAGRAVDDFTVSWSGPFGSDELRDRIGVVPGARVEAAWPTREVPGTSPDYDLLGHVAADPDRAFVTLVDAVPDLVSAEWAVAVHSSTGEVAHGSWQAPETVPMETVPAGLLTPIRPSAFAEGPLNIVSMPVASSLVEKSGLKMSTPGVDGGLHLVVARSQGPAFHRAEVDKIVRLVEIVSVLAGVGVSRIG